MIVYKCPLTILVNIYVSVSSQKLTGVKLHLFAKFRMGKSIHFPCS